jgi:hypothetical protein
MRCYERCRRNRVIRWSHTCGSRDGRLFCVGHRQPRMDSQSHFCVNLNFLTRPGRWPLTFTFTNNIHLSSLFLAFSLSGLAPCGGTPDPVTLSLPFKLCNLVHALVPYTQAQSVSIPVPSQIPCSWGLNPHATQPLAPCVRKQMQMQTQVRTHKLVTSLLMLGLAPSKWPCAASGRSAEHWQTQLLAGAITAHDQARGMGLAAAATLVPSQQMGGDLQVLTWRWRPCQYSCKNGTESRLVSSRTPEHAHNM